MAVADVTAETGAYGEGYHFLVRRLHSLSGIIPVGVFLCIHLSINASIIAGPRAFQFAVDKIHMLNNLGILKLVETFFIFIPIAFHAIVGIMIWLTGKPNAMQYRYSGSIRYTLQRWTGIIAVIFILIHLWHVHWLGSWLPGGARFDPHAAPQTVVTALQGWGWSLAYIVGVLSAVFHLANGVWTFLISWGITIGPRSQTLSGRVCLIIGIVLGLLGFGGLLKIKTMDAAEAAPAATAEGHAAASYYLTDSKV